MWVVAAVTATTTAPALVLEEDLPAIVSLEATLDMEAE